MKKNFQRFKAEAYKFGFDTLVVIVGVLIAFTLNDWNENRKLKDLESELLIDIRDNLFASKTNLSNTIVYNKKTMEYYQQILDHIKADLPYNIALDTAFSNISYWSDPQFTYTAYETLKSKGLDIIQNDSIKHTITQIYEQYFPFLMSEFNAEWEVYQSLVLPFVSKNILYINGETARPNNFNELKTNNEFHNIMGLKMNMRKYLIQYTEEANNELNSLIAMIDQELSP